MSKPPVSPTASEGPSAVAGAPTSADPSKTWPLAALSDKPIWTRPHLLGLEELSVEELTTLLDLAVELKAKTGGCRDKLSLLPGRTCANLFFESSTRTRNSFGLAARRLGADGLDFTASGSSLSKGESLIDTAKTIEAMGIASATIRHSTPGAPHILAQHLDCAILNAGDGPHEHPTQGLLDVMTIREHRGRIAGLTVALVGDIAHSRTARSNIWALKTLGANVILCGPSTLVSPLWRQFGCEVAHHLDEIVGRVDVLNLLRVQFERQVTRPFPSVREYATLYGMNRRRMRVAKDDVLILAPGPINRGVEVSADVADGPHSVILGQVTNGLAVRMAALYLTITAHERSKTSDPNVAEGAA